MPAEAAVIAKIVVVNQQNQVLVLWRSSQSPRPGQVDLPGGGVYYGEDPIMEVIREAREEVGLEVEKVRIVDALGFLNGEKYYVSLGYMGRSLSNEVVLSWEHARYAWLGLSEALELDGWRERDLRILRAAKGFLK